MTQRLIAVDDITGKKSLIAVPSGGGIDPDVQIFTASGTWTKPADCKQVRVILIGGGGGGGSGSYGTTGEQCGGGGGSGGQLVIHELVALDLAATVAVTIGSGGAGGVTVSTNNYNGKDGAPGTSSTFGALLTALGGKSGFGGAKFKSGRLAFAFGEGGSARPGGVKGGSGKVTAGEASADTVLSPSSGGAGAGIITTSQAGGAGGTSSGSLGGSGGSGGYSRATGAGDSGIAGSNYGAGGGGGGASKGTASGAGGNGASGYCVVVSY